MNDVDTRSLAAAIEKANAAAERLVKCAEGISNPVYSVVMQGRHGELQVQAVRHFQGQIILTVANPFDAVEQAQRRALPGRGELIEQQQPTKELPYEQRD